MSKLSMARVVVQALYAMKELPRIDDRRVKVQMKVRKDTLESRFKVAVKVLTQMGDRP